MHALLKLSGLIDRMNTLIGRSAVWLVLAAVLIGSVNAFVCKAFNMSSNAFLEMQWYLFVAVFLLCAPHALLKNEHVARSLRISGAFHCEALLCARASSRGTEIARELIQSAGFSSTR